MTGRANAGPASHRRAMRGLTLAVLALGGLLAGAAGAATLYRWTDDKGVTHFTQEPPPDGTEARRLQVESGDGGPASPALRVRRCRDFRSALRQLNAVDDVPADHRGRAAARERARRKIRQWCDAP